MADKKKSTESKKLDMTKGGKFEPITKAQPAPTEKPGRKRGESRKHH